MRFIVWLHPNVSMLVVASRQCLKQRVRLLERKNWDLFPIWLQVMPTARSRVAFGFWIFVLFCNFVKISFYSVSPNEKKGFQRACSHRRQCQNFEGVIQTVAPAECEQLRTLLTMPHLIKSGREDFRTPTPRDTRCSVWLRDSLPRLTPQ